MLLNRRYKDELASEKYMIIKYWWKFVISSSHSIWLIWKWKSVIYCFVLELVEVTYI